MDRPGSVRAARERLAQAQALKRAQGMPVDSRAPSPFIVPRVQPGAVRSPVRNEVQVAPASSAELDSEQSSPQWPLPSKSTHLPLIAGNYEYAPTQSSKEHHNLQKVSTNSSSNLSQPAYGSRSDEMIPISLSEKSQSISPDLRATKDPRTLSQTTVSSLGTIPDFPVASNFPVPEQSNSKPQMAPKLQPSLYQQFAVVSPISEEHGSLKSYASSHAIPQAMTDFYFDETPSEDEQSPKGEYPMYEPPAALLRQASVGRRIQKPAVTSIKGRSKPLPVPGSGSDRNRHGPAPVTLSSARYDPTKAKQYSQDLDSYLGDLEKGSDSDSSLRQVPRSLLSERVGTKRPPNLDFEKPKANETRSSMTSLPELIRRAGRLRVNLDNGRTASRLDFVNGWAVPEHNTGNLENNDIGDMMASPEFDSPRTDWPSGRSGKPMLPNRRGRFNFSGRGSGWSFNPASSRKTLICLLLILIAVITTAIVIPVVLIVIPKQQADASNASCLRTLVCSNNGLPMELPDGSCACACAEGFQGVTCKTKADASCGTAITAKGEKITTGSSIVPLLGAASKYGIPLDAKLLVAQFNNNDITCATENALINLPTPGNSSGSSSQVATTINGIIVAATPTAVAAAQTPSTTGSSPTVTSLPMYDGAGVNSTAQEFAKIGILFVLQNSHRLDKATSAQQSLTSFMTAAGKNGTNRSVASEVALGNGYFINMWDYTIKVQNGSVYGNQR